MSPAEGGGSVCWTVWSESLPLRGGASRRSFLCVLRLHLPPLQAADQVPHCQSTLLLPRHKPAGVCNLDCGTGTGEQSSQPCLPVTPSPWNSSAGGRSSSGLGVSRSTPAGMSVVPGTGAHCLSNQACAPAAAGCHRPGVSCGAAAAGRRAECGGGPGILQTCQPGIAAGGAARCSRRRRQQ